MRVLSENLSESPSMDKRGALMSLAGVSAHHAKQNNHSIANSGNNERTSTAASERSVLTYRSSVSGHFSPHLGILKSVKWKNNSSNFVSHSSNHDIGVSISSCRPKSTSELSSSSTKYVHHHQQYVSHYYCTSHHDHNEESQHHHNNNQPGLFPGIISRNLMYQQHQHSHDEPFSGRRDESDEPVPLVSSCCCSCDFRINSDEDEQDNLSRLLLTTTTTNSKFTSLDNQPFDSMGVDHHHHYQGGSSHLFNSIVGRCYLREFMEHPSAQHHTLDSLEDPSSSSAFQHHYHGCCTCRAASGTSEICRTRRSLDRKPTPPPPMEDDFLSSSTRSTGNHLHFGTWPGAPTTASCCSTDDVARETSSSIITTTSTSTGSIMGSSSLTSSGDATTKYPQHSSYNTAPGLLNTTIWGGGSTTCKVADTQDQSPNKQPRPSDVAGSSFIEEPCVVQLSGDDSTTTVPNQSGGANNNNPNAGGHYITNSVLESIVAQTLLTESVSPAYQGAQACQTQTEQPPSIIPQVSQPPAIPPPPPPPETQNAPYMGSPAVKSSSFKLSSSGNGARFHRQSDNTCLASCLSSSELNDQQQQQQCPNNNPTNNTGSGPRSGYQQAAASSADMIFCKSCGDTAMLGAPEGFSNMSIGNSPVSVWGSGIIPLRNKLEWTHYDECYDTDESQRSEQNVYSPNLVTQLGVKRGVAAPPTNSQNSNNSGIIGWSSPSCSSQNVVSIPRMVSVCFREHRQKLFTTKLRIYLSNVLHSIRTYVETSHINNSHTTATIPSSIMPPPSDPSLNTSLHYGSHLLSSESSSTSTTSTGTVGSNNNNNSIPNWIHQINRWQNLDVVLPVWIPHGCLTSESKYHNYSFHAEDLNNPSLKLTETERFALLCQLSEANEIFSGDVSSPPQQSSKLCGSMLRLRLAVIHKCPELIVEDVAQAFIDFCSDFFPLLDNPIKLMCTAITVTPSPQKQQCSTLLSSTSGGGRNNNNNINSSNSNNSLSGVSGCCTSGKANNNKGDMAQCCQTQTTKTVPQFDTRVQAIVSPKTEKDQEALVRLIRCLTHFAGLVNTNMKDLLSSFSATVARIEEQTKKLNLNKPLPSSVEFRFSPSKEMKLTLGYKQHAAAPAPDQQPPSSNGKTAKQQRHKHVRIDGLEASEIRFERDRDVEDEVDPTIKLLSGCEVQTRHISRGTSGKRASIFLCPLSEVRVPKIRVPVPTSSSTPGSTTTTTVNQQIRLYHDNPTSTTSSYQSMSSYARMPQPITIVPPPPSSVSSLSTIKQPLTCAPHNNAHHHQNMMMVHHHSGNNRG